MQNIFQKRLLRSIGSIKLCTYGFTKHTYILQQVCQQAIKSYGQLSVQYNRYYSQVPQQKEQQVNYEVLVSRITNSEKIEDLLKIYEQYQHILENEHIVLCLRILARQTAQQKQQTQQQQQQQEDILEGNEIYKQLVQKARDNITKLNEFECQDMLFWLRKFTEKELPLYIKEEDIKQLCERIRYYVQKQVYNVRSLANIYFDLAKLSRSVDEIAQEILRILKQDIKQLTSFTALQILQGCTFVKETSGIPSNLLSDYVAVNLQLNDTDLERKTQFFKYMARLEFNIHPSKYKLPNILYTLKKELGDNLEKLNERGVINIVQAYEDLPKYFPDDLLNSIKEMVLATIQMNPDNIKSPFLLELLEKHQYLKPYRRFHKEKINIIYDLISKRIGTDYFLSKLQNVQILCDLYQQQYNLLNHQFIDSANSLLKNQKNTPNLKQIFPLIYFLVKNKVDVEQHLEYIIKEQNSLKEANGCILYIILSYIEKYNDTVTQLETDIYSNTTNLYKMIPFITKYKLPSQNRQKLLNECIQSLLNVKNELNLKQFYKLVFCSTDNQEQKQYWMNLLSKDIQEYTLDQSYQLFQGFEEQEHFIQLLSKLPTEAFPLKKINKQLRVNRVLLYEFLKYDTVANELLKLLKLRLTTITENVKLQQYYYIYQQFHNLTYKSTKTPALLLKTAYDLTLKQNSFRTSQLEQHVQDILIHFNLLDVDVALNFYKTKKDYLRDENLVNNLLMYITSKNPSILEQDQGIRSQLESRINKLEQGLSDSNPKVIQKSLCSLLNAPQILIESKKEIIQKRLKEQLKSTNEQNYLNIIQSLNPNQILMNSTLYKQILRDILQAYNKISSKLHRDQLITILSKFYELKLKPQIINNQIVQDVNKQLSYFRNDECFQVILLLVKFGIHNHKLIDKLFSKIIQNSYATNKFLDKILQCFYNIGYSSEFIQQKIVAILNNLENYQQSTKIQLLIYLPILKLDNENQFYVNLVHSLTTNSNSSNLMHINDTFARDFIVLAQYVYKQLPEFNLEQLQNVFTSVLKESNQSSLLQIVSINHIDTICNYLKLMQTEHQRNFELEQFPIDIYIPDRQQILKVISHKQLNSDKVSYNGQGHYFNRIYNSFTAFKPIFINIHEFNYQPDHLSRVKYLNSLGIQSNIPNSNIDFSSLPSLVKESTQEIQEEESITYSNEENAELQVNSDESIIEEDFNELEQKDQQ